MRVVTAVEKYEPKPNDVTCFLAGGITNCPDWQKAVIEKLRRKVGTDNLVIFNPRRDNFPIDDPNASAEQIAWEFNQLEQMDIFSMYFSSGKSDQPICMYELGRNIVNMQMRFPTDWEHRIVVTVESGYKRENDVVIQTKLATNHNLVSVVDDYEKSVDTHAIKIYRRFLEVEKRNRHGE